MDVHAFDFVDSDFPTESARVVAMFGDDAFLKNLALRHLQSKLRASDDDECSVTEYESRNCEWRDVADVLRTVSLFGNSVRCVVIRDADEFVSDHRQQLESYVVTPAKASTLVLDVKSWPKNTRLAKAVLKTGITVECRPPQRKTGRKPVTDKKRLVDWMVKRGKSAHKLKMSQAAAEQLLELAGEHLGLIDQELAKLSLYTDGKSALSADQIVSIVGGWRTQTTWDLLEKVCDGDAGQAIVQLDRLLIAGEHPLALFGAFAWTLRRYAAATRYVEQQLASGQRVSLSQALVAAGIHQFQAAAAERRLRQIGRLRAHSLLAWLVEADAQMKGSHSSPERARYVLERLIFRLCRQTAPPKATSA
jgi:DNA polymerase-3 subunit delta